MWILLGKMFGITHGLAVKTLENIVKKWKKTEIIVQVGVQNVNNFHKIVYFEFRTMETV